MAELFLYSLRENGGGLESAPVTVVVTGERLSPDDAEVIRSFDNTNLRVMPRMGGTPHTNKFSAFYAVDEPYDVMVYLDCDTVVMSDLKYIIESFGTETKSFKGLHIGEVGANSVRNYERLIERFALSENESLAELEDERFPNGYPLFNSGVMVLTQATVEAIRDDAPTITYQLYEDYLRKNSLPLPFPTSLRGDIWTAGWERLLWRTRIGVGYREWMTEQLGVALALLKNDIHIEILDEYYNWTQEESPDGDELPGIYHYMAGLHDIERENLFSGEWISRYESSDSALKRELAQLAQNRSDG